MQWKNFKWILRTPRNSLEIILCSSIKHRVVDPSNITKVILNVVECDNVAISGSFIYGYHTIAMYPVVCCINEVQIELQTIHGNGYIPKVDTNQYKTTSNFTKQPLLFLVSSRPCKKCREPEEFWELTLTWLMTYMTFKF